MNWRRVLIASAVPLLLTGCASVSRLEQFTLQDLRSGQARAERAGDSVWADCYKALADDLERRAGDPAPRPRGLADAVMMAHLIYHQSQAGVPDEIKVKCGPVALEVLAFAVRMGLQFAPVPLPLPLR